MSLYQIDSDLRMNLTLISCLAFHLRIWDNTCCIIWILSGRLRAHLKICWIDNLIAKHRWVFSCYSFIWVFWWWTICGFLSSRSLCTFDCHTHLWITFAHFKYILPHQIYDIYSVDRNFHQMRGSSHYLFADHGIIPNHWFFMADYIKA